MAVSYNAQARAVFNSLFLGRKSLHLCLAGLRIGWFDPIAEASQLADDSRCALLPRLFGDRWAPFFVTSSLVQDQPDQSTLSMGDGPDGLIMSETRDASVQPGVGRLAVDQSFPLRSRVLGMQRWSAEYIDFALNRFCTASVESEIR